MDDVSAQPTERISLSLENGSVVQVDVAPQGLEDVALDRAAFKEVTDTLEGIVEAISGTIHKAMPTKASVKFGLDIGVESGKLTAVMVKGSGKANLEINLEWDRTAKIPN